MAIFQSSLSKSLEHCEICHHPVVSLLKRREPGKNSSKMFHFSMAIFDFMNPLMVLFCFCHSLRETKGISVLVSFGGRF